MQTRITIGDDPQRSRFVDELNKINKQTADVLIMMGNMGGNPELLQPRAGNNLALEVIDELSWLTFRAYSDDMESLLS